MPPRSKCRSGDNARDLIGQIASVRATLAILRYDPEARSSSRAAPSSTCTPTTSHPAVERPGPWGMVTSSRGTVPRPAGSTAKPRLSGRRPGMFSLLFWPQPTWPRYKNLTTSSMRRPKATGARCNCLAIRTSECQRGVLGLARICYEWNDLEAAEQYGRQSVELARQYDPAIDRVIISEVFLARLRLTRGDVAGAAAMLAQAQRSAQQRNFPRGCRRLPRSRRWPCCDKARWPRLRNWPGNMSSRSARRACSWPRETPAKPWRCSQPIAGRWKPGTGTTNGSRRWCCRRSRTRSRREGPGHAGAGRSAGVAEPGASFASLLTKASPCER